MSSRPSNETVAVAGCPAGFIKARVALRPGPAPASGKYHRCDVSVAPSEKRAPPGDGLLLLSGRREMRARREEGSGRGLRKIVFQATTLPRWTVTAAASEG